MKKRFDYERFERRRERLGNLTLGAAVAWWVALFAVSIGSSWSESIARLKDAPVLGGVTADRILGIGAAISVAIAIGGPWLVRHMHRPPQLFLMLRDFQSKTAAQFATSYVRRRGAKWGYWLTLENADLRAADSVGGDVETDPEDPGDRNQKFPIGSWWAVSLGLALVLITLFILRHLDSAPLTWMRKVSDELGTLGGLAFGVAFIVGFCFFLLVTAVIVRWALLAAQRAVVLPGRVDSEESCQRVLDSIVSRIHRRATTLTLGPLPIVSVDDAWWRAAIERCVVEASLVVFILVGRESASLRWEIDHVRDRFDPRRTLFIELGDDGLRLWDGNGQAHASAPFTRVEDQIDAVVRGMLRGHGTHKG